MFKSEVHIYPLQFLRLDNVVTTSKEFRTTVIEQHRVTHRCFLALSPAG